MFDIIPTIPIIFLIFSGAVGIWWTNKVMNVQNEFDERIENLEKQLQTHIDTIGLHKEEI